MVVVGCCQHKVNCQLSGAEQNLVCDCAVLEQMKKHDEKRVAGLDGLHYTSHFRSVCTKPRPERLWDTF